MEIDKLSINIREFLERASTKSFLLAARQFIHLLEDKTIDKENFYSVAHNKLLDLYTAGHKLDVIDLKYSSAERDFDSDKIFENNNADLISELGGQAFYWEIFDPTYSENNGKSKTDESIKDKEASQGWLVDDFADIYRDLKIELTKIDKIGTNEA